MFKFFDVIINLISTLVDLVLKAFQIIIYVFQFIGQGWVYMQTISVVIPAWVTVFVVVAFAYIVIITIINKGA